MTPSTDIARLLEIMAALRTPGTGCAWDLKQTFRSIAPYTLEEAYEVVDAVERDDMVDLREELGDLLLQVVFHARLAEEEGRFGFPDVVESITRKLIRRHPHVFGEKRDLSPEGVKDLWDSIKSAEKSSRSSAPRRVLDDVPHNLPALMRASKLQAKAARVGFDWDDPQSVVDKVREELDEVIDAMRETDRAGVAEEIGDLLFAAVNLARHHGVDAETALRAGSQKFSRRFAHIEDSLGRDGRRLENATLAEMEALWAEAKRSERAKAA